MDKIKHIFFDLDRTLWDFETNSRRVISDLFHENNLESRCKISFCAFIEKYEEVNLVLWEKYRSGEITKQQLRSSRFYNSMQQYGYDDFELGLKLEEEYVQRSPFQKSLIPGTIETLDHLSQHFKLHIITNGFKEVQHIKLDKSEIKKYFDVVIISEEVGIAKPDPLIFQKALETANANAEESLMVGDDLHVDVNGAIAAGMKGCFFNPEKNSHESKIHLEIILLEELVKVFPGKK